MTRMADPERPRDDHDYDDERFETKDGARFFRHSGSVDSRRDRARLVAAVAVPYVLELANQPAPKTTSLGNPR